MELLLVLPVTGFALAWQRWQRCTSSAAILHAVAAMVMALFIAGLIGILKPAVWILILTGSVCLATAGKAYIRKPSSFPVPIGVLLILSVLYWLVHGNSALFFFDEFSHWGLSLREMLATDSFLDAETNSLHGRYLPGTALWQYMFAQFSARPEGAAYLAQFILLLTPLLVLWETVAWRQYFWLAAILAMLIVVMFNFGHGFTSLYVDHLLGAWFIGILLNYLLEFQERSQFQRLAYLLPLAFVVLIKTTGIFFSLAAAGIIAFVTFLSMLQTSTAESKLPVFFRALTLPVATGALCLVIMLVWNANRDRLEVYQREATASGLVGSIASGDSIFDAAEQSEITRRFVEVMFHQQISKDEISAQYHAFSYPIMPVYTDRFRMTTVSLLGFSLIAIFFLWKLFLPIAVRNAWAVTALLVWLTAPVYLLALYFSYKFVSLTAQGIILSSYVRYAHSILLPLVVIIFAAMIPAFSGHLHRPVKLSAKVALPRPMLAFSTLLLLLVVFERPYLERLYVTQTAPDFRLQTEPLTKNLRAEIGDSRLWVFFPNESGNGFPGKLLTYQLSPGRTFVEQDQAAAFARIDELKTELSNWDYLWIAAASPEIDAVFESLVGGELADRVFKIEANENSVNFTPIYGIFDATGT